MSSPFCLPSQKLDAGATTAKDMQQFFLPVLEDLWTNQPEVMLDDQQYSES